ncbi:MAG TPA: carboxymuconolactone decarboxylase family protein [Alphaproteobacteria bacterium]|nr:carboxymuconolactone decarboxylase family protein [Alphaproteobacteria bacterium]
MPRDLFAKGLATRRAVLGAGYVKKSLAAADAFTMPFQELVTECAWGKVWSRPGLPRKTRSLVNVAMLSALNRPHELKLHLRGAVNNGCTRQEIQEVLLQVAIYAGFPAALDGFRTAHEFFRELDAAAAPARAKAAASNNNNKGRRGRRKATRR